ncbi:hypothetical protein HCN44_001455 [Aphidius gifuensis]|uniref:Uncharacterized protein n=1 Tax=Aphidius gifuensis TaxID=684658 RepID=A0A834XRH0_APHGI|nr:hypothetical protein HCN44_001455 [Aphidius gifuensis]
MDINSENIELENREPLLITCTGTKKMEFFYPPNTLRYEPGETLFLNREYSIEDISQKELNQTHTIITFRRNQTEYGDTGWYGCGYSDQNPNDIFWIYVEISRMVFYIFK